MAFVGGGSLFVVAGGGLKGSEDKLVLVFSDRHGVVHFPAELLVGLLAALVSLKLMIEALMFLTPLATALAILEALPEGVAEGEAATQEQEAEAQLGVDGEAEGGDRQRGRRCNKTGAGIEPSWGSGGLRFSQFQFWQTWALLPGKLKCVRVEDDGVAGHDAR